MMLIVAVMVDDLDGLPAGALVGEALEGVVVGGEAAVPEATHEAFAPFGAVLRDIDAEQAEFVGQRRVAVAPVRRHGRLGQGLAVEFGAQGLGHAVAVLGDEPFAPAPLDQLPAAGNGLGVGDEVAEAGALLVVEFEEGDGGVILPGQPGVGG